MTAYIVRCLLLAIIFCNGVTWSSIVKPHHGSRFNKILGLPTPEAKCADCKDTSDKCHNVCGFIDAQDLDVDYTILLIPAGSTDILIEEIKPSTNNMVLRGKGGKEYINGHVDFPSSLVIAHALWLYDRSLPDSPAPDRLIARGPTNEPLYLSLYMEQENVGIQYKYCVPKSLKPPTDKKYNWIHDEFTPCSVPCGGGTQIRNVTCRTSEQEIVDDNLCNSVQKPVSKKPCNEEPCPSLAEWVEGPWEECSESCNGEGIRKREVTCQKIIANGYMAIVPEGECLDISAKPEDTEECNRDVACPEWFTGEWSPCSKLCDAGVKTRQVGCRRTVNSTVEVLKDSDCVGEKPEAEKPCMDEVCRGVDWVVSNWKGCDTCFSKIRTRNVNCASVDEKVYDDSLCAYHKKPHSEEPCDVEKLPPCEAHWYATQWSKCSEECGKGVQTRKVFCGQFGEKNVTEVNDTLCSKEPRLKDEMPCEVPIEDCPPLWFAGPWSKCSKPCGGGVQTRNIKCLRGKEKSKGCNPAEVPLPQQKCNTKPCRRRKRSEPLDKELLEEEI